MSLSLLVAATLATTPITVDQVREQSRQNTQALQAQLDAERAEQQTRIARSAIFPHVTLNGSGGGVVIGPQRTFNVVPDSQSSTGYTQTTVDTPGASRASFELSVTASQLIYDGGRWWSQIAQAGALAEAQAGQSAEQRLSSEYEGVRRFYELLRAQESLEVLKQNEKRSQEQLERAQSLFTAGRAQKVDVLGAQVNLGTDQLSVVHQKASVVNSQGQLAVWVMHPGTDALEATTPSTFDTPPASAPTVEEALTVARESRPLLKAVTDRVRASQSAVGVASAGNWPSLSAAVTAGRQGPSADPFFTDPTRQNYLQGGVNLRWDLFTGNEVSAQVQQAELERRRTQLDLEQAERELEAEVRSAVAQLSSQIEASQIARANVETSKQALEVAQARFTAGAGSTIEVRDAQLKLAQAELTWVQNRIDTEIARAALERTMGRGVNP